MKLLQKTQYALLAFGVIAIAWSAGSLAYSRLYQAHESEKFDELIAARGSERMVAMPIVPHVAAEGEPVGKLEIARLNISVVVLEGVETSTLRLGAGHVTETSGLDGDGNVAIAAHRDTFFRSLEGIQAGDQIHVSTLQGVYEYNVDSTEIVDPDAVSVLDTRGYPELTLITCYPFHYIGSAPYRFIVHARRTDPLSVKPGS